LKLEGKVGIVTGAAGGFGRAIANKFAREGADVVLADINSQAAESVAAEVRALGRKALVTKTNVADEGSVQEMVDAALQEFGQIDILVNNAGLSRSCTIQELSLAEWEKLMAVNLTGTFLCCKAVIEHMVSRNYGKIINVSSISGHTARGVGVDYSASKTGVLGITRTLALQVAPAGVNVNAVAPGPIVTPLFEKNFTQEAVDRLRATIPFRRQGKPEDVANLIAFLASEEAGWITGEVIAINGGAFMG